MGQNDIYQFCKNNLLCCQSYKVYCIEPNKSKADFAVYSFNQKSSKSPRKLPVGNFCHLNEIMF